MLDAMILAISNNSDQPFQFFLISLSVSLSSVNQTFDSLADFKEGKKLIKSFLELAEFVNIVGENTSAASQ